MLSAEPQVTPRENSLQQIGESLSDFVGYLYTRWQDEKEYENFKDYIDAFKKRMLPGMTFLSASSKPFIFIFAFKARKFVFQANSRTVTLKEIR